MTYGHGDGDGDGPFGVVLFVCIFDWHVGEDRRAVSRERYCEEKRVLTNIKISSEVLIVF